MRLHNCPPLWVKSIYSPFGFIWQILLSLRIGRGGVSEVPPKEQMAIMVKREEYIGARSRTMTGTTGGEDERTANPVQTTSFSHAVSRQGMYHQQPSERNPDDNRSVVRGCFPANGTTRGGQCWSGSDGGSRHPASVALCRLPLAPVTQHPGLEQGVRDRKDHRPDEEPEDAECDEASDDARKDHDQRQGRPLPDENGPDHVVD